MKNKLLLLIVTCLICTVSLGAQDVDTTNINLMKRVVEELYNQRNFEAVDEIIARDYVEYTNGVSTKSPSAVKETVFWLLKTAPDFRVEIKDIFSSGDKVVVRWEYSGTNQKVEKIISIQGMFIGQFAEGKLKNGWQVFDNLNRFKQLGYSLIPPPGEETE
jgi:predicted ester cyclase